MIRQLPVIPTIVVVAAAATMVWLGFWQLGRAEEKAELIARYEAASADDSMVTFPSGNEIDDSLYRRSLVTCESVSSIQATAGTAANGAKGWAHRAQCRFAEGGWGAVDLGFSQDPNSPDWQGGEVEGRIAPDLRLVADPPQAGLYPLAKPDPNDLPNNHLAYAGQWFFFALTALVIYGFAVRSRLAKRD